MDGVHAINGEDCDDGNSIDDDGCSNTGMITPGYRYDLSIYTFTIPLCLITSNFELFKMHGV